MKIPKAARMMKILTALGAGNNLTVDKLSELFSTTKRTIFRDLNELGKLGIPVHRNAKTDRYSIEPRFFAASLSLDSQEALALLMLAYNAKNLTNMELGNSALIAALNIENRLPGSTRRYCNSVLKRISIKAGPQALKDCSGEIFGAIQKAMWERRVVKMHYCSFGDSAVTELSPYHLMYSSSEWHIFGNSSFHHGVRSFRLNHIKELKFSNKHFTDGEDFDVYKFIGGAWETKPEGKSYDIKLHFSSEIASSVAQVRWHSTQTVIFNEDGSVIMEFCVDGLNEILWWILSYGAEVHVLAPQVLRDKVSSVAQSIAKLYDQGHDEEPRDWSLRQGKFEDHKEAFACPSRE
jgi:predicted DNA-binding transcriptional regulator YafY